jgi:hypothetical protein
VGNAVIYKDNYREFTMMKKMKAVPLVLSLAVAAGLVGCEGNSTTTTIQGVERIDLAEVDKTITPEVWSSSNYQAIAALGYASLVDNLNLRGAFLGLEKNLGALLNLFSTQGTLACDLGTMTISQDDAHTRVVYNACQNGDIRFEGEVWTDLTVACDDSIVTETFIMGYKDYTQRQKLGESTDYSQMYSNGEYQFITRSQLDTGEITDDNLCPTSDGIDSKVVLIPQEFTQVEDDDSITMVNNSSYELQPNTGYVEYENLELTEAVADSLTFAISATVNMNALGNGILMSGSGFQYGLDGKASAGTISFVNGNSQISLTFSSESVLIELDLDTTVDGIDASETISQDDF